MGGLAGGPELGGHVAGDADRHRSAVAGEDSDHRARVDVEQGAAGHHRAADLRVGEDHGRAQDAVREGRKLVEIGDHAGGDGAVGARPGPSRDHGVADPQGAAGAGGELDGSQLDGVDPEQREVGLRGRRRPRPRW